MKKQEALDTRTIIDLSKQALYRARNIDEDERERVEKIIKADDNGQELTVSSVNYLLNFTFKHRHEALQPKTIRSMLNDIFEAIGVSNRKDSYMATVSRSDLELIHNYIMSNKK